MKRQLWLLILLIFTLCTPALAEAALPLPTAVDLPLLVNNNIPLPEGYKPTDLIEIFDLKRNFKMESSETRIERHVFEAMNEMFKTAKSDGQTGFIVTSGYRSKKQQENLYKNDEKGVAAIPGHSEHQTGLAFDVGTSDGQAFGNTTQYQWMRSNCWTYGFILRYPKGLEAITGIPYEPWHYRYVGVDHAMAIKRMGTGGTLEAYIQHNGNVDAFLADEAAKKAADEAEKQALIESAQTTEDAWAVIE